MPNTTKSEEHIQALVADVQSRAQHIKGPREATDAARNQKYIDMILDARAQKMTYPYVGSGLGRGAYVEFEDGSVKLDFIIAIGVHILGHSHPRVLQAGLRAALSDVVMQGNLQLNKEYATLSSKVTQLARAVSRLKYCWLCPSGSMANENAFKIVRQKHSPRHKIIAMHGAFAGRTTMMSMITDNEKFRVGLPRYDEVFRLHYPRTEDEASQALTELKKIIHSNAHEIAAFMIEPVQGEGGFWTSRQEYLEPLLQLCKDNNIAIWLDEVQSFARTGEFFAFQQLGIGDYVDVCTIGKALQGAAVLYSEEYRPGPGLLGGTFAGSTVALATGLEVLRVLEDDHYMGPSGRIAQINKEFVTLLDDLRRASCRGLIHDITSAGLMVAFTPFQGENDKSMALMRALFKNGVMAFRCGRGPFRIRMLVPAIATSTDLHLAAQIIEKSLLEPN